MKSLELNSTAEFIPLASSVSGLPALKVLYLESHRVGFVLHFVLKGLIILNTVFRIWNLLRTERGGKFEDVSGFG